MTKIKPVHGFRVGDVVKHKDGEMYVVSGTKGWVHTSWRTNGKIDSWISLSQEIGATSYLTHASECKLVTPREKVGAKWWAVFSKGEK